MNTVSMHFSSQFRRLLIGLMSCLAMAAICSPASADTFTGSVEGLMPPDHRPCIFFSIAGVTQADPAVPGSRWVAVRQQNGWKEVYALLLAAKHTGAPVTVTTSGTGVRDRAQRRGT